MNTSVSSRNKMLLATFAVLLFILPVAARWFWFYRGSYRPSSEISIPPYGELELPQPELTQSKKSISTVNNGSTQILFDISHGNQFQISELDNLTNLVTLKEGHLNVTNLYGDLQAELKKADAFVVIAPSIPFSNDELLAVKRFVERGGRLLVISDPTRTTSGSYSYLEYSSSSLSDIEITNLLLEPFAISFSKDYVYNMASNEGNFRNVFFSKISRHDVTKDLKQVVFYGSHSIMAAPTPLISGDADTFSSLTDQAGSLAVAASAVEGRVLAFGDLNFMTPPYHQVADNAILIENIANFLTISPRQRTLADFPHLFTRPVTILVDPEKPIGKEMLTTITGAQQSLDRLGLHLSIAGQTEPGRDLIAFGVFPPPKVLQPFLKPFGLVFSETEAEEELEASPETEPEEIPADEELDMDALLTELYAAASEDTGPTVTVPGFGKLRTSGIGLILYENSGARNSIILLADTPENLKALSSAFYNGSLESCTIQGKIAVCLLNDEEDDFYWEYPFDDYGNDPYSPEELLDELGAAG
jgi:hypothetical protein